MFPHINKSERKIDFGCESQSGNVYLITSVTLTSNKRCRRFRNHRPPSILFIKCLFNLYMRNGWKFIVNLNLCFFFVLKFHSFICNYLFHFSEENVWKLCQDVSIRHPSELSKCSVIFVSNERRTVPLWRQRAGKEEEKVVIWVRMLRTFRDDRWGDSARSLCCWERALSWKSVLQVFLGRCGWGKIETSELRKLPGFGGETT